MLQNAPNFLYVKSLTTKICFSVLTDTKASRDSIDSSDSRLFNFFQILCNIEVLSSVLLLKGCDFPPSYNQSQNRRQKMWYMYDVDVTIPIPNEGMAVRTIRIEVKARNNQEAYQAAKSLYPNAHFIQLRGNRPC